MDITQEVLSFFIEDGLLFSAVLKDGTRKTYLASGNSIAPQIPMAVLVGAQTYSSAETAATAVQASGRGILIGETTHGKGTIQTSVPLLDGSLLKYTIAHWHSPSGESFNGRGVTPDMVVIDNPDTSQDEVLEAALEYLLQYSKP